MPFVRTPQLDMHYETGGKGKPVLLLHGNFASWRWWQPILKNAPEGYSVYAPDMRGCGDTDQPEDGYTIAQHADDLEQLVQALQLPRLHLVGHSLGGCVALEYALKHPKRIKTLVLVAPAPAEGPSVLKSTSTGNSFVTCASTLHSAFRLSESLGHIRKMLKRALTRMMPPDQISGDFEALVDDAVRMSRHAAVGHIQTLNNWDVRDALAKLNLPVLIIGGKDDRLIPPDALHKAAQLIPNGRLMIWPGVGHAPQLECPERFIRIWLKFVEQQASATKICKSICRLFSTQSIAGNSEDYLLYP